MAERRISLLNLNVSLEAFKASGDWVPKKKGAEKEPAEQKSAEQKPEEKK